MDFERWMEVNKVGYEEGEHIRDDNLRSEGIDNTIGRGKHRRPASNAPEYWVYGQNCFWWASAMLEDVGIETPASVKESINRQNLGVGTTRRYTDNETAKALAMMTSETIVARFSSLLRGYRDLREEKFLVHKRTKGFMMEPGERTDVKP